MAALRIFFFLTLIGFIAGCASGKPKPLDRARVSGKITLDNKPLTSGSITFEPGNGEPPAVMEILDGNYEGKAPVGKNKVIINATRKVSLKDKMGFDGPGYDSQAEENLLPARYNTQTQITREVEAGEDNRFNFELLSK